MNLKNIKNLKVSLGYFILTVVSMAVMAYWTYIITYSEFENQRFNSSVNESLKTLNLIKANEINNLKISNSLFVFASIDNVNLEKIKLHNYFCNQINKVSANEIINIMSKKVSLSEMKIKKFSNKYEKVRQLCTEVK